MSAYRSILSLIKAKTSRCYGGITSSYEYNTQIGRIGAVTVGSERTAFTYNENGLLSGISLPSGYELQREFDDKNRVRLVRDGEGVLRSWEYDAEGRIRAVMTLSGKIKYTYEQGLLSEVVDTKGNKTRFFYKQGVLCGVEDAEGQVCRYEDKEGNL